MKAPYNVGVGVAAFICHDGKVLVQQRTGAHGAKTWAPPGGKLDYGETPEKGVAREIKEETDLDIYDICYLGYTNDIFATDKLHYITLWYAANTKSADAKITEPHKCIAQKWCKLNEIPSPLFLPTENILKDSGAVSLLKKYL